MHEFLWALILLASLVGLWFARVKRKSDNVPEIQRPPFSVSGRFMALCARLSPAELRWWLVIVVMGVAAYDYIKENEVLRVGLNLLLFFEWHAVLVWTLLALSVVGFLLAWRNELTIRGVVGAGLLGGLLALFIHFEWYCHLVILFTLGLFAVLLAWWDRQDCWKWVARIGIWMILFLVAALFLSHVLYGVPEEPFDAADIIKFSLALAASLLGLLWAWHRRARLLGWTCAFLAVVLLVGLVFAILNVDVPRWLDDVDDYALIGLGIVLVFIAFKMVRSTHLQPLGWVSAVMIVFLGGGLFLAGSLYGQPEDFTDIEDQFKYGSIGSDNLFARGIPYFIWQVLPDMFPPEDILKNILPAEGIGKEDYMPRYGKEDGPRGKSYEALGLLREEYKQVRLLGHDRDSPIDRPIGFSKRKVFGLDFIGMNCAFCHASTLLKDAYGKPQVISAMPADTVDIELYFLFLFGATGQPEFKSGSIMEKILEHNPDLKFGRQLEKRGLWGLCQEINNSFLRLAYRIALIPVTRSYAQELKKKFVFIDPKSPDHLPRFGPGRVDAWSPGKATLVKPPLPVVFPGGSIDHMSIWNQKARNGMRFHWDGNTNDINERNIIAGLVVNGPQIECLDVKRVERITDWIMERPAPRFNDFAPDKFKVGYDDETARKTLDRLNKGKSIFQHWCASCHAPDGDRVGRVEPVDARELNTDPARMRNFTAELQNALNTITRKSKDPEKRWELRNFRTQNGYVNMLLDGVWLRAPYLHNGSVPTMWDLLKKPCEDPTACRPRTFYRGQDLYDWENLGFKDPFKDSDAEPEHPPRVESGDIVEIVLPRGSFELPISPEGVIKALGVEITVLGKTAAEIQKELASENVTVKLHTAHYFLFDTTKPGNSNQGHLYGTDLTDEEKWLLIEFLKTL